jgi:hypothetical protein
MGDMEKPLNKRTVFAASAMHMLVVYAKTLYRKTKWVAR